MTANGNGKWKSATKEAFGSLSSDFVGTAVGIGAFTYMDEVAPETTKYISKIIGKICVEPFLDSIEWGMQKFCGSKYCQPDLSKSREERAGQYAHYLTRFGIAGGLAATTEMIFRATFNWATGVKNPTHPIKLWIMDKVLEGGFIGLANTVLAKQTDLAIDASSQFMQDAFDVKKERADKAADGTIRYQIGKWTAAAITSAYAFTSQVRGKH